MKPSTKQAHAVEHKMFMAPSRRVVLEGGKILALTKLRMVMITAARASGGDDGKTIDCHDNDASIHPGATEICGDGIAEQCEPPNTATCDSNCQNQ